MGSPPNEPYRGRSEVRHQVTISKSFYMQTTEVTVKQWHSIMGRRMMVSKKGTDNMPVTHRGGMGICGQGRNNHRL